MTTTAPALDHPTFTITEEIFVRASIEQTFDSLLAQLGRLNETLDGKPLEMILEARPGGRWYRDLGADNGHLWAFVQSIKRPSLLEMWGPLFMSTATTNNMIYRLTEASGGTLISFKHTLVGPVPDDLGQRTTNGWAAVHARVKSLAEAKS
ncbi:MAG TPA: SRPBCC domain-containing protein [Vicinamibacterales bacterium]|nr:SRPBCC domain-containing protein [Vicinamibacterales bacterium]